MPVVIVTDENLGTRLATEIRNRGREAKTVPQLRLRGQEDDDLLRALANKDFEWVLLTGDDRLPWQHAAAVESVGATVATIRPQHPDGYTQHQWRHDVAHRWVHAIGEQEQWTVRRYSLNSHRLWTPPRGR